MKSLLSDFLSIIFGEPEDHNGYSWTHILITLGTCVVVVVLIALATSN